MLREFPRSWRQKICKNCNDFWLDDVPLYVVPERIIQMKWGYETEKEYEDRMEFHKLAMIQKAKEKCDESLQKIEK
ncbi:MAG: hypothetical protein [Arizlama microvirus]|nr:MAG: hypothetical protein [Arizlama microvirus]